MKTSKSLAIIQGCFHSCRLLTAAGVVKFWLSMGVELHDVALFQFVFNIVACVVSYPLGVVVDYYGPRKLAIFACVLVAIYNFLCIYTNYINVLILAHFVHAIGLSLLDITFAAWILGYAKVDEPSQINYVNYLGHLSSELESFGSFFTGFLGAVIAMFLPHGYQDLFVLLFIILIIFAALLTRLPCLPTKPSHTKKTSIFFDGLSSLCDRNVQNFMIALTIISCVLQPIYHYWQPYFQSALGIGVHQIDMVLGICFSSFTLSKYFANRLMRQYFKRSSHTNLRGLYISMKLIVIVLFLMLLFGGGYFVVSWLSFCGLHACLSVAARLNMDRFMNHCDSESVARVIGITSVFSRLSTTFFLGLIYLSIDSIGISMLFVVNILLVSVGIFVILNDSPRGFTFWKAQNYPV